MIDAIFALNEQLKRPRIDDKYTADQAIVKATFIEKLHSRKLLVVFPPWHMPNWFLKRLEKRLQSSSSSLLIYEFNPLVLEGDVIKVKNSFEYIALSTAHDIDMLRAEKNLTTVNLLSLSVGGVALCLAAEKIQQFDDVTMIVPGNDLAVSVWNGWRTRRLRNTIRSEGYKLSELQKEWADLGPGAHLDVLKDHNTRIVLAKEDHFIPYSDGKQLLDSLNSVSSKVTSTISKYGHLATIWKFVSDSA